MSSTFQIGRHFAPSELVALGPDGPFRLTIPHVRGIIVEYFQTTEAALHRMVELEKLLGAAQGFSRPSAHTGLQ